METKRVFADFNNRDPQGRVRLNTEGTLRDVNRQGIRLEDGLELTIADDDLEAEGIVRFSEEEGLWVVEVKWSAVRDLCLR